MNEYLVVFIILYSFWGCGGRGESWRRQRSWGGEEREVGGMRVGGGQGLSLDLTRRKEKSMYIIKRQPLWNYNNSLPPFRNRRLDFVFRHSFSTS